MSVFKGIKLVFEKLPINTKFFIKFVIFCLYLEKVVQIYKSLQNFWKSNIKNKV